MEMYIIWATDANGKLYKFIRGIRNDNTFTEQIDDFITDVYDCLDNNCRIDIMIKQDDIEFEGSTTEFDRRYKKW